MEPVLRPTRSVSRSKGTGRPNTGPAVAMEVRLLTYLSPGLPQSLLKAQADPLTRLELEAFGLERFVAVDEEDYDAKRLP